VSSLERLQSLAVAIGMDGWCAWQVVVTNLGRHASCLAKFSAVCVFAATSPCGMIRFLQVQYNSQGQHGVQLLVRNIRSCMKNSVHEAKR